MPVATAAESDRAPPTAPEKATGAKSLTPIAPVAWLDLAPGETPAADRAAVTGYAESIHAAAQPGGATASADPQGVTASRAREVAQQLAVRIAEYGPGRFSIGLAPAELGRVEITLQEAERGLQLAILVERPETLDLMRRHLAVLAQEMRAFGLDDVSLHLEVSAGGAGRGSGRATPFPERDQPMAAQLLHESAMPAPSTRLAANDHLDIRL